MMEGAEDRLTRGEQAGGELPVPGDHGPVAPGEQREEPAPEGGRVRRPARVGVGGDETVQGPAVPQVASVPQLRRRQGVRLRQTLVQHRQPVLAVRQRRRRPRPRPVEARIGHQRVQPGEGEDLRGARLLRELRHHRVENHGHHPPRQPYRQDPTPEPGQGRRVGRHGHRPDQPQSRRPLLARAVLEEAQRGLAPAQRGQLGPQLPQLPRDDLFQGLVPFEDPFHIRDGQIQDPQRADQPEPVEGLGPVAAMPAGAAPRLGQQTPVGVVPHGLHGGTGPLGELPDAPQRLGHHGVSLLRGPSAGALPHGRLQCDVRRPREVDESGRRPRAAAP